MSVFTWADFSDEEVKAWVVFGVLDPWVARHWRRFGMTPEAVPSQFLPGRVREWQFVHDNGLPVQIEWGRLRSRCSGEFAREGFDQAQGPGAVAALVDALIDAGYGGGGRGWGDREPQSWTPHAHRTLMALACRAAGLNWGEVALCVQAGMRPRDAVQYLRDGGDMGPVRLLLGLGA